ncbi:MAG: hypothetical protein NT023_16330 [Armatimonadetes bacterium]|nr:hypothetical protein [Armatimonadota bacterium]
MAQVKFDLQVIPLAKERGMRFPIEVWSADPLTRKRAVISSELPLALDPGMYSFKMNHPDGQIYEATLNIKDDTTPQIVSFYHASTLPAVNALRSSLRTNSISRVLSSPNSTTLLEEMKVRLYHIEGWGKPTPQLKTAAEYFYHSEGILHLQIDHSKVNHLQCHRPNGKVYNLRLPTAPKLVKEIKVAFRPLEGGEIDIEAHIYNPVADNLVQYRNQGFNAEAESLAPEWVAENSEKLIDAKKSDPVAAVIGVLTLLKFNRVDVLEDLEKKDWLTNLSKLFTWLPDGTILRGEYYARQGDYVRAMEDFLTLETKGLPFFRSVLSYAVDRLHGYTHYSSTYFPPEQIDKARTLLKRLSKFSQYTESNRPFLIYTGKNPSQPEDKVVEKVMERYGWIQPVRK